MTNGERKAVSYHDPDRVEYVILSRLSQIFERAQIAAPLFETHSQPRF
jgi:hypothetical protein